MEKPSHSTTFEQAICVTPVDSHTYWAFLDANWCMGSVPHGGYTASILYRLGATHFKNTHSSRFRTIPEPTTLQISFLNRTSVGPALLKVQDMKVGGRISTIHVTLSQLPDSHLTKVMDFKRDHSPLTRHNSEFEVKLAAYITASPPEAEGGPSIAGPWSLYPPPAPGSLADGSINFPALLEDCADGQWMRHTFSPVLKATKQLEIYGPRSQHPATLGSRMKRAVDQWARFCPEGQTTARWSNEAVMFLVDMFPAASDRMCAMEISRLSSLGLLGDTGMKVRSFEKVFWYPTVTMTIDLKRRLPPEGVEWLHSRVTTKMVRGSRGDLDVVVLDQRGEIVALATQVALVVDASRNFSRRSVIEKL
ncbi:uncharacterized protein N7458_000954 [Penicillium daleae]|uniref:Thioesterase-like superfamily-domain-containing protein n=1 Tax=Penicillium daleae TaxID=63821 RepID=A0AAD6G7X3_9EURO|nr:uncharacterized protein N7458_000954 [Penicillium daleae]KAJ5465268.1 hypothetical protein N7458_000954 [Penicillium daleae]